MTAVVMPLTRADRLASYVAEATDADEDHLYRTVRDAELATSWLGALVVCVAFGTPAVLITLAVFRREDRGDSAGDNPPTATHRRASR